MKETAMSDTENSIHDFDFSLICEYFSALERQGPGSPEATIQALGFIGPLSAASRIADIGCGTGGQTRVLARHTPGQITGIDLFPAFIDLFNAHARQAGLEHRVTGTVASMDALPFDEASLDLIWSEGAIYNIGFRRGLAYWRTFLKPGGTLAVTEASWFTPQRPAEIERFWTDAYPEIDTIPAKMAQLQEAGFSPVAAFVLPETCWTDHFYVPQRAAQQRFLAKHAGNKTAEDLVANQRHEAELYDTFKSFYGYAFYIGKKI